MKNLKGIWKDSGKMNKEYLIHPIDPVFDKDSRILILGSFPSVKSRESGFFYGHPQNRFWKVTSAVFDEKEPESIEEKRAFLLRNHIAVWDVIKTCRIRGSSDASIEDAEVNDLSRILNYSSITKIYVNGKTAERLYRKYMKVIYERDCIVLPSSSPANAAWSLERLIESWRCIRE